MKLPNVEHALVEVRKLSQYCLSREHSRGRHKARAFAPSLGLTASDAPWLRLQRLDAAAESLTAVEVERDAFGTRYRLDCTIENSKGRATVRTGWIVLRDADFPCLTTCYVLRVNP